LRDLQANVSNTLNPDRVQATPKHDRLGDITANLLDLIDEYAKDVTRLLRMKYEIKVIIDRIGNADHRTVLEWRYLNCLKWDQIAERMNYHPRHVFRLHKRAILSIECHSIV